MSKIVESAYKSYILYLKRKYKKAKKGRRDIKRLIDKVQLMYEGYKKRGVRKKDLIFARNYYMKLSRSKRRMLYVSLINKMILKRYPSRVKRKDFMYVKSYKRELINVDIYEHKFAMYDLNKNVVYDILNYCVKNDMISDDDIVYFVLSYICFGYDVSDSAIRGVFNEIKSIVVKQDVYLYEKFEKNYSFKTDYVQTNAFEFDKKYIDRISQTIIDMLKIYESYACYNPIVYSLTIRIHKEK
ncbi:MAG: hypothetical protein RMJ67_05990 [Elusimicrobiota bacterium]|nr:hypothetical protein [Endomicrobiia bacterium]MDW8166043.1 hypothetical protein [Elusimicrobiota bacterium]